MTTKAEHYAEQLENARCESNWDAVPELVRKVRKHAPQRACLTLAAETECAISKATTAATRPSAAATARDLDVSVRCHQLQAAIEEEKHNPEERFQAQICVGWLHWVVGDYGLALERLPQVDEATGLEPADLSCEWTHVCALKSSYLRANCLMRDAQRTEALVALRLAVPALSRVWSGRAIRKQLRYWSELFLTEYCMLSSQAIENGEMNLEDSSTLASFREWARYWEAMEAPFTGGYGFKGSVPRRQVWKEYYMALSGILENDLPYETGLVERIPSDSPARSQLRAELNYAEAAYRSLLLAETSFPRADEQKAEVEAFVKQVANNWSILCGRGWREDHLGQGGRSAVSRSVLEILYGAATRTYHSTAILRCLFSVHLSLAEFDLAFKALDSYLAIVNKGKARVDKTGEAEPSLDDDGTVLETMAQGIMALCRYGHRQAGEKARQIGAELEDLLSKLPQIKCPENGTPVIAEDAARSELHPPVASHIVALAWQAIGLSHAHWSRLTPEAESRIEIQSKAIRCLRKSLAAEFGHAKDIRSFFSLGLLLAERRELTDAIELTRSALMSNKIKYEGTSLLYGAYWQERALIPLWHLLALLLSARQEYAMASRACEGALEQFKDSELLFGRSDSNFRSEHLNDADAPASSESRRGLVDDMDDWEKESLLEIKMTQLALIELTESPDVAVNASYELLTMFTRLFGSVTVQPVAPLPAHTLPPRMSATFRSIRGSIFGSKTDRSTPKTRQRSASAAMGEQSGAALSRPATTQSTATVKPVIQITEENEGPTETPRPGRASSSRRQRSGSRRRNSLKKRNRSGSRPRQETSGGLLLQATAADGDSLFAPALEPGQAETFSFSSTPSRVRIPSFSKGRAMSMRSYMSTASKSTDYTEFPVNITHAPPHLLPLIQFSKERERAQRMTMLIKIWLTIAGFYRRANMLEDSKGAISEAQKLVQSLETESSQDQGPTGWRSAGWAKRKSVDNLWGDAWSELGLLSLAQGEPYTARSDFERALTHCPDHPAAIVNLCNILLDMYSEKLLPTPVVPPLDKAETLSDVSSPARPKRSNDEAPKTLPSYPLGLGPSTAEPASAADGEASSRGADDQLPAPYKATRLPLVDRLAARDRAFTLLSGLTRLGSGWDYSDAWFALARAYEESGQPDKAKEVLWWCVELEEAMGVRGWRCLGGDDYLA